jgi:hypothetical protein
MKVRGSANVNGMSQVLSNVLRIQTIAGLDIFFYDLVNADIVNLRPLHMAIA